MGWDAIAVTSDRRPIEVDDDGPVDDVQRRVFGEAAWNLREDGCWIDGLLLHGGLDLRACGDALAAATGRSVHDPRGWTPDVARVLSESARWTDEPASRNARAFLESCSRLGLGVEFSW